MQLIVPFAKPVPMPTPTVPIRNREGTTTMEPSTTQLRSSASDAADSVGIVGTTVPSRHPEEPLLYMIPNDLFPTYRPLPGLLRAMVVVISAWISAVTTGPWQHWTFLQPLAIVRGWRTPPSLGAVVAFLAKTIVFSVIAQLLLQDIILPPSRISMADLCQKYHLPSAISKYQRLTVPSKDGSPTPVGVHYLKYSRDKTASPHLFDAVYVQHGFGASSLSWLPALPSLVHRLGARVGLGHDMVGFGFTDRPKTLDWYTTDASARIGTAVLGTEVSPDGPRLHSRVALFGHSLGAIGTLKMALQLPRETAKLIILCSPALGLSSGFAEEPKDIDSKGALRVLRRFRSGVGSFLRKALLYPVGGYVLRRVVGLQDSWKLGLKSAAWGNPDGVRDSDVVRYQWPSIGQGWERGLLKFARAQKRNDDELLLQQVLNLPNTAVAIVIGTKDKVIPPRVTSDFLSTFQDQNINVVPMEGLGHNTFEEDTEAFMGVVDTIISIEQ